MDWTRFSNPLSGVDDEVDRIIAEHDRRAAEKAAFGVELWNEFEREGIVALSPKDVYPYTLVTLTRSTYPNVEYQITRWDEDGPVGHTDITRGKSSAIDEMWHWTGGLDWRDRWELREKH